MGKANQRNLYFEKHCKNAQTVTEYIAALSQSPFRTHQRMAVALMPMLDQLIQEKQEQDAKLTEII